MSRITAQPLLTSAAFLPVQASGDVFKVLLIGLSISNALIRNVEISDSHGTITRWQQVYGMIFIATFEKDRLGGKKQFHQVCHSLLPRHFRSTARSVQASRAQSLMGQW